MTFEWSAERELRRVLRNGSEIATYSYDPLGRRVEKIAGGVTTKWIYADEDILQQSVGSAVTKFIHGPGIDEPMAQETGGSTVYLHADGLGSVVKHTDQVGTVINAITYDAWGNVITGTPSPYGFGGREHDAETGLIYLRARSLDPRTGRLLSQDPIEFFGGINFYRYVNNNPVNDIDPWGLYDCRYDIAPHRMVCSSSEPGNNPPFVSENATSGTGVCRDNPSCQAIQHTGPVPEGDYTIGPQLPNSSRRNLTPHPGTNMHGRSGFQTHGCSNPATCSKGCIAFTTNADRDEFNRLMQLEPNSQISVVPW